MYLSTTLIILIIVILLFVLLFKCMSHRVNLKVKGGQHVISISDENLLFFIRFFEEHGKKINYSSSNVQQFKDELNFQPGYIQYPKHSRENSYFTHNPPTEIVFSPEPNIIDILKKDCELYEPFSQISVQTITVDNEQVQVFHIKSNPANNWFENYDVLVTGNKTLKVEYPNDAQWREDMERICPHKIAVYQGERQLGLPFITPWIFTGPNAKFLQMTDGGYSGRGFYVSRFDIAAFYSATHDKIEAKHGPEYGVSNVGFVQRYELHYNRYMLSFPGTIAPELMEYLSDGFDEKLIEKPTQKILGLYYDVPVMLGYLYLLSDTRSNTLGFNVSELTEHTLYQIFDRIQNSFFGYNVIDDEYKEMYKQTLVTSIYDFYISYTKINLSNDNSSLFGVYDLIMKMFYTNHIGYMSNPLFERYLDENGFTVIVGYRPVRRIRSTVQNCELAKRIGKLTVNDNSAEIQDLCKQLFKYIMDLLKTEWDRPIQAPYYEIVVRNTGHCQPTHIILNEFPLIAQKRALGLIGVYKDDHVLNSVEKIDKNRNNLKLSNEEIDKLRETIDRNTKVEYELIKEGKD